MEFLYADFTWSDISKCRNVYFISKEPCGVNAIILGWYWQFRSYLQPTGPIAKVICTPEEYQHAKTIVSQQLAVDDNRMVPY